MQPPKDTARHRAHMPEGASGILNARSLATAHRRLAELLQPGLTVLDVGCATGAITRGIAEVVAPGGSVVGTDVHAGLIEQVVKRQVVDIGRLERKAWHVAVQTPCFFNQACM